MTNNIKVVCGGCYEMFYTPQMNSKSVHDRQCYYLSIQPNKLTKEIFKIPCVVCENIFQSTRKEEEFCSTNCGIEQFKMGNRKNTLPVGYKRGNLNDHLLKSHAKKLGTLVDKKVFKCSPNKTKKKVCLETKAIAKEKFKKKVASDKKCKSIPELAAKYSISGTRVRAILLEYGVVLAKTYRVKKAGIQNASSNLLDTTS